MAQFDVYHNTNPDTCAAIPYLLDMLATRTLYRCFEKNT